ncbi:hypothetical protein D3C80_1797050 [compost metagenome]
MTTSMMIKDWVSSDFGTARMLPNRICVRSSPLRAKVIRTMPSAKKELRMMPMDVSLLILLRLVIN